MSSQLLPVHYKEANLIALTQNLLTTEIFTQVIQTKFPNLTFLECSELYEMYYEIFLITSEMKLTISSLEQNNEELSNEVESLHSELSAEIIEKYTQELQKLRYARSNAFRSLTHVLVNTYGIYYADPSPQIGSSVSQALHNICKEQGIAVVRDSFKLKRNCVYYYDITSNVFAQQLMQYVMSNSQKFVKFSSLPIERREKIVKNGEILTEATSKKNIEKRISILEKHIQKYYSAIELA